MFSIRRLASLATVSVFLAACGGGGGSGGGNNNPPGGGGNPPGGGNNPPAYTVSVAPGSVQFSALARGTLPAAQDVTATFTGEDLVVGTPPGTSLPSWLNLSIVGSPTSSPAQVRFTVTTTGTAADSLATTIRFVTAKSDGTLPVTKDVTVTYTITDPLDLDTTSLEFDATAGTTAAPRTVQVLGSGTNWTASSNQPWLTLSQTSGTNSGSIEVTANATSLAAGTHTAQVRVEDTLASTVRTVPVTFHVSANRWNVARTGVQLLAFTDSAARPAHVVVTNDGGTAATWTATANVQWLDVTASGANGDTLTITPGATASNLGADAIFIATVTISGNGIQDDTVRVGYFRSSAAEPTSVQAALDLSTSVQPAGLAIDPIRPYAYVGLSTNTVRRVNLLTGAVFTLFTAAADAKIGRVVVSGDGQYLYASSIGSTGDVLRFNLDFGVPTAALPKMTNCCAQELAWVRSRGVPLLVTGHFEVYNADTGAAQTAVNVPVDGLTKFDYLAAMSDGSEIWAIDNVSATGDACTRAASVRVVTRPEDGTGHLAPFRDSAPLIGQSAFCPSISQLASSADGANLEVIGQNAGGTVAFFEGARGGALSEIASTRHYEHLGVGLDGLKALSYLGSNGAFSDGIEVLDANNGLVHTFEQLQSMQGVRFSADDRFLVVIGNSQSAAGDLQVLKIP
ncbi:MAG TPA: BACON domain-containing protein [Steroidobacteraceae bacterium]|jgi:hypothetical protein|nr:BACON domain-containing protein [Steroidobacteraceae bacterium]